MKKRKWKFLTVLIVMLAFVSIKSYSQSGNPTDSSGLPEDPTAMHVYTTQQLSFGAFTTGASGGTVVMATDGQRTSTGTVQLLNMGTPTVAIFEIEAPSGSNISLLNGSDATLTGSNGGSMSMHIGASDPASPFISGDAPPSRTQLKVGGTLAVGNSASSPPGSYTGNFYITFNYE